MPNVGTQHVAAQYFRMYLAEQHVQTDILPGRQGDSQAGRQAGIN